jgi:nitronate monooxygenase
VVLEEIDHPIVLAPMAGGPATVSLAAAVSDAGGLGFLAAGYRSAETVRDEIRDLRGRTSRPFGVNLFVPGPDGADEPALREYVAALGPGAGEPRWDDDGWRAKLDVLLAEAPAPVVSFTFGCPAADEVAALREHGSEVWVTVTSVDEALTAAAAGAGALVLQGIEAGGHRASFDDRAVTEGLGLLALIRLVSTAGTGLPLVATGGVSDGAAVAAVLAAGAAAAQVGTAFMRAPEAGTHPAHSAALAGPTPTALTRAFSGRTARALVNRFMQEHVDAPSAYPQVHHATTPLRAAARERGDAGGFNLWAGQAHTLAVERPAADTVRALAVDARAALEQALRVSAER